MENIFYQDPAFFCLKFQVVLLLRLFLVKLPLFSFRVQVSYIRDAFCTLYPNNPVFAIKSIFNQHFNVLFYLLFCIHESDFFFIKFFCFVLPNPDRIFELISACQEEGEDGETDGPMYQGYILSHGYTHV